MTASAVSVAATRAAIARRTTTELGLVAGTIAVVAWGLGPLFVRAAETSTPAIIAWRLGLGAPTFVVIAWLLGGRFTAQLMRDAAVPGLVFGVSIMIGYTAITHTSVANASLIGNLMPVAIVVIAPWLGEQVQARQYAAVAVSMVGLAAVIIGGASSGDSSLFGDALAFFNVGLWTLYFVRMKGLRDRGHHAWALVAAVSIFAAAVAVPVCAVVGDDIHAIGNRGLAFAVLNVLVPGVLGHGLMTWASRHLKVTVSSLLTLGSPVVSGVGAWLWFDQWMTGVQLAGAALVLGSLAAIALNARAGAARQATLSDPLE